MVGQNRLVVLLPLQDCLKSLLDGLDAFFRPYVGASNICWL